MMPVTAGPEARARTRTRAHASATVLLPRAEWSRREHEHQQRADALTAGHRSRRSRRERHPVEDFLWTYYSVKPGELVWLRGKNGSGKTSLLRIVAGLSRPEAGTLTLAGGRPGAYIGHANALKDDLTVTESLVFLARLHDLEGSAQGVRDALRTLAIHHRRHAIVRTLSQGQRRRVALARLALEREPSLWVLDEPFDALDVHGIEAVNRLLVAHLARGGSVLLTSHLALGLPENLVTELELPVEGAS